MLSWQLKNSVASAATNAGLAKGMMSYALPPSMGTCTANPRFVSSAQTQFSAPQAHSLFVLPFTLPAAGTLAFLHVQHPVPMDDGKVPSSGRAHQVVGQVALVHVRIPVHV